MRKRCGRAQGEGVPKDAEQLSWRGLVSLPVSDICGRVSLPVSDDHKITQKKPYFPSKPNLRRQRNTTILFFCSTLAPEFGFFPRACEIAFVD